MQSSAFSSTIVAASILASDFSNLEREVRRSEAAGADWLHCDVMDGHFVDNISFGAPIVEAIARHAKVPLDVHLMISRPDHYFARYTRVASTITVHVEAPCNLLPLLGDIRAAGCAAGLALNPATPFESVLPYLDAIDLLLVMTVVPGFGGQPFMSEMMGKVQAAVQERTRRRLGFHVQVDGGINETTAKVSLEHGANVLVGGTALFGANNMAASIRGFRSLRTSTGS